jgi:ketosteroid isomerase-like protein
MSTDDTRRTQETARRYFDAWTSRDSSTVASLLASDFRFASGAMLIEGKDAFLNAGAFPQDAKTTMVAEAYQGETAFQMYDATSGANKVRIVEQLTVRDGLIKSSNFIADMSAFMALINPAETGSA